MEGSILHLKHPDNHKILNQINNWWLRDAKLDTNKCNANTHNNISFSNLQHSQCTFLPNTAFIETDTTDHHAQLKSPLDQVKPFSNPDPIFLTDDTSMRPSHTRILPNLPQISTSNKIALGCPSNNNISLVSLFKLFDEDCETRINKKLAQHYNKTKQFS